MEKFAKLIRTLTVAPIMALALVLVLYFSSANYFDFNFILYLCIALLSVGPSLAYLIERVWHPYQKFKPSLTPRQAERELAIKLSIVCYGVLTLIVFTISTSIVLKQMVLTFFLSVIFLYLITCLFNVNPSGHLCGVVGPILFLSYTVSPYFLCSLILVVITAWSSLKLKRHTLLEVFLGALIPAVSFALSLLVV